MVRAIAGNRSSVKKRPVVVDGTLPWFRTYCIDGKLRVPLVVGE